MIPVDGPGRLHSREVLQVQSLEVLRAGVAQPEVLDVALEEGLEGLGAARRRLRAQGFEAWRLITVKASALEQGLEGLGYGCRLRI